MPEKFATSKRQILIAFYQFIRESDGQIWLTASDIEPYCDGLFSRSFIQLTLQTLEAENLLEGEENEQGRYESFSLTAKGISAAEKAAEDLGVWDKFDDIRPLVNEVVELNNSDTAEIKATLDELSASLISGNDVGNLSEDEVASAIAEVSAIRKIMDSAKVRASALAQQSRQTLLFIASQASKTAIGELAKRALHLILTLLGYG